MIDEFSKQLIFWGVLAPLGCVVWLILMAMLLSIALEIKDWIKEMLG